MSARGQCRKQIWLSSIQRQRRCRNGVYADGFCAIHHPEAIAKREARKLARAEATERLAQTPEVQAALDRLAAKGVRVNTRGCAPMDAETVEALAALADAARKAFDTSAGEKP